MYLARPTLPLLFTTIATLATLAVAEFRIGTLQNTYITSGSSTVSETTYGSCPTNKYSCDCYVNGVGFGRADIPDGGDLSAQYFSIEPVCGVGKMNLYATNGDDTELNIYYSGGDGSIIGNCYPDTGSSKNCPEAYEDTFVQGGWYRYTQVCGT